MPQSRHAKTRHYLPEELRAALVWHSGPAPDARALRFTVSAKGVQPRAQGTARAKNQARGDAFDR